MALLASASAAPADAATAGSRLSARRRVELAFDPGQRGLEPVEGGGIGCGGCGGAVGRRRATRRPAASAAGRAAACRRDGQQRTAPAFTAQSFAGRPDVAAQRGELVEPLRTGLGPGVQQLGERGEPARAGLLGLRLQPRGRPARAASPLIRAVTRSIRASTAGMRWVQTALLAVRVARVGIREGGPAPGQQQPAVAAEPTIHRAERFMISPWSGAVRRRRRTTRTVTAPVSRPFGQCSGYVRDSGHDELGDHAGSACGGPVPSTPGSSRAARSRPRRSRPGLSERNTVSADPGWRCAAHARQRCPLPLRLRTSSRCPAGVRSVVDPVDGQLVRFRCPC